MDYDRKITREEFEILCLDIGTHICYPFLTQHTEDTGSMINEASDMAWRLLKTTGVVSEFYDYCMTVGDAYSVADEIEEVLVKQLRRELYVPSGNYDEAFCHWHESLDEYSPEEFDDEDCD